MLKSILRHRKTLMVLSLLMAVCSIKVFQFWTFELKYEEQLPEEIISIKLDESRVFLIPLINGYLQIDTGYAWDYNVFQKALRKNNISLNDIKFILITHAHDDHVGFINQQIADSPSTSVIFHPLTSKQMLIGKNNTENGGGLFNRPLLVLFRIKQFLKPKWTLTFEPYPTRPNDYIVDRHRQDLSGLLMIDAQVIYTPGHTSDSISLLLDQKYLFSGDLTSTSFNWLGAKNLTVFNEDLDQVYTTWQAVNNMGVDVIVPSHGTAFKAQKLLLLLHKHKHEELLPIN